MVTSFSLLHSILLYDYISLFLLLLHLDSFLCQAIIFRAAVNILTHFSDAHVQGSLGNVPRSKIVGL